MFDQRGCVCVVLTVIGQQFQAISWSSIFNDRNLGRNLSTSKQLLKSCCKCTRWCPGIGGSFPSAMPRMFFRSTCRGIGEEQTRLPSRRSRANCGPKGLFNTAKALPLRVLGNCSTTLADVCSNGCKAKLHRPDTNCHSGLGGC